MVRSRSTYVAVWTAWIGLAGLWAPFWVAAVSFGRISVYVCGGLAGLDRFWRFLGHHFGSRRSIAVRSRSTYVAVWTAWIGLGGLWAPFWVAAVDCGEISVYVCGGLDGLDRFGRYRIPGSCIGSGPCRYRVHGFKGVPAFFGRSDESSEDDQSGKSAEILRANRLKNAETHLKPSPEINVEELQYFFRPSAPSSNTHQRGRV